MITRYLTVILATAVFALAFVGLMGAIRSAQATSACDLVTAMVQKSYPDAEMDGIGPPCSHNARCVKPRPAPRWIARVGALNSNGRSRTLVRRNEVRGFGFE
jgi:hypothetical protein